MLSSSSSTTKKRTRLDDSKRELKPRTEGKEEINLLNAAKKYVSLRGKEHRLGSEYREDRKDREETEKLLEDTKMKIYTLFSLGYGGKVINDIILAISDSSNVSHIIDSVIINPRLWEKVNEDAKEKLIFDIFSDPYHPEKSLEMFKKIVDSGAINTPRLFVYLVYLLRSMNDLDGEYVKEIINIASEASPDVFALPLTRREMLSIATRSLCAGEELVDIENILHALSLSEEEWKTIKEKEKIGRYFSSGDPKGKNDEAKAMYKLCTEKFPSSGMAQEIYLNNHLKFENLWHETEDE